MKYLPLALLALVGVCHLFTSGDKPAEPHKARPGWIDFRLDSCGKWYAMRVRNGTTLNEFYGQIAKTPEVIAGCSLYLEGTPLRGSLETLKDNPVLHFRGDYPCTYACPGYTCEPHRADPSGLLLLLGLTVLLCFISQSW